MTQIKLRRDTGANFSSKNPILGNGEPAYETDTKKLKIGDGTTPYTQLAYFSTGGGGGSVDITATLPLRIVDGVISLDVDGQTIQIVDGKLHANLDELGNEVNTLAGDVTSVQTDLLKKQDGLVSASPIEIKKSTGLTVVGTPMSGNDFVMDSMSDSAYCLFPENFIAVGNEYQFKFTTPSSWAPNYSSIFDFGDPLGPQYDYTTGNISVWTERDGAEFEPIILGPTLNTTYYVRLKMVTSTQVQSCYSTDGITFTEWKTIDINPSIAWEKTSRRHVGVGYDPTNRKTLRVWTGTIDLKECYVIANGIKYYMFPDAKTGAIGINLGSGLTVTDGKLTATGGGSSSTTEKYGLEGDYCSRYGIVDCPNGILEEGTGQVTLKAGVVMQMTETEGLTTNASDMPHTITSTVDFDLFYTSGSLLEATQVIFSEQEPDNGATGAIAWYNGTQWQFKSNDAGNVWRAAPAVRLAHFHITDGNITRIDYIGNRHLNKVIPVTTDTNQTITGSKYFTSLKLAGYHSTTLTSSVTEDGSTYSADVIKVDEFKKNRRIIVGDLYNYTLVLKGKYVVDAYDKKFITQSSVTAGSDNLAISETTDGIQITCDSPTNTQFTTLQDTVTAKANMTDVWTLSTVGNASIPMSWGASGSKYIAPANGRFLLEASLGDANEYIRLYSTKNGISRVAPGNVAFVAVVDISVDKGDEVILFHNISKEPSAFKFVQANGD